MKHLHSLDIYQFTFGQRINILPQGFFKLYAYKILLVDGAAVFI